MEAGAKSWVHMLRSSSCFSTAPLGPRHVDQLDALIDYLRPGGLLLVDDLLPDSHGSDRAREILLAQPRLAAAQVLTSPSAAVVIGARKDPP